MSKQRAFAEQTSSGMPADHPLLARLSDRVGSACTVQIVGTAKGMNQGVLIGGVSVIDSLPNTSSYLVDLLRMACD